MGFRIAGTGSALPKKVLTNDDLSKMVDTSDEWIYTRTGIRERHIVTDETSLDLSTGAARRALDMAGLQPSDIGLTVCATLSADRFCPSLASDVKHMLGTSGAAFDLSAACSGFLYALRAAGDWLAHDPRPALVIGTERLSYYTNWNDRSTCVLFGDGSGAAILVPDERPVYTDCAAEPDVEGTLTVERAPGSIHMDGREVYKYATRVCVERLRSVVNMAGIALEDIKQFVAHQANWRIVQASADRMGLPIERFFRNIDHVGNTSAASVPIALDEANRAGLLRAGDWLAMVAFGGGLTSGAALLQW